MVMAPLLSQPKLRQLILDTTLPIILLKILQQVVRRTRLWKSEQDDVACELCAHFIDGLTAGQTAEELVAAFGPPSQAARLIRRAKIRNRPLAWHVWRRTFQGTLAACVFVVLAWSWLIFRFHSARPGPTRDAIGEWDARNREIPLSDRAWPLYREGFEKLDEKTTRQWSDVDGVYTAFVIGPRHKKWPQAKAFLHRYEDALALFLRATERPNLGYVYRDPANDSWLRNISSGGVAAVYPPDVPSTSIYLPQIQDLCNAGCLIGGATQEALEADDAMRAAALLHSRLRLANQIWHASEFVLFDLIAIAEVRTVAMTVARNLDEQSQFFGDRQLVELAHELAAACDGTSRVRFSLDRRSMGDWIAHVYSDDGDGNGRLTVAGLREVLRYGSMVEHNDEGSAFFWKWMGQANSVKPANAMVFELAGSGLAATVADRRDMQAKADEMANLYIRKHERPLWEQSTPSEYDAEMERLRKTPSLQRKFWPLILVLRHFSLANDGGSEIRAVNIHSATLVAIALELYHRREGHWPDRLRQLVPGLLTHVPIDQFDGQPLRYRLIEGAPLVYSVGPDRLDDGGIAAATTKPGEPAAQGDLRLFPPVEGTKE